MIEKDRTTSESEQRGRTGKPGGHIDIYNGVNVEKDGMKHRHSKPQNHIARRVGVIGAGTQRSVCEGKKVSEREL